MPKDDWELLWIHPSGAVCGGDFMLLKNAEAIPISDHGELIERDAAYDSITEQEGGNYIDMDAVYAGLQDAPVVIPSDKGEKL